MHVRSGMFIALVSTSCARPAWERTWVVTSETGGATALAFDGDRAAVIHPDGYSLVTVSDAGTLETQARVTGVSTTFVPHQGGARLVGDRLVVATFDTLELFDVSVAPELRHGSVPLPDFRGPFELLGTTLYSPGGTYDISDVTAPRLVEGVGVDAAFMRLTGDTLYVVAEGYGTFDVYSVADPEAPERLAQIPLVDFGVTAQDAGFYLGYLYPVGDHVIIQLTNNGYTSGFPPFSVNVADPANPTVAQGLLPDRYAECSPVLPAAERDGGLLGLTIGNDWFVRAHQNFGGLGVLDVRDPGAPTYLCDGLSMEGVSTTSALDVGWLGDDTLLVVHPTDSGPLMPEPVNASLLVLAPK